MTEESYVDTRVKEFADHIQCDPELAQELYFKYDVDLTSDGADKMSLDAEIKALASLKRKLETERDKLNTGDLLQSRPARCKQVLSDRANTPIPKVNERLQPIQR